MWLRRAVPSLARSSCVRDAVSSRAWPMVEPMASVSIGSPDGPCAGGVSIAWVTSSCSHQVGRPPGPPPVVAGEFRNALYMTYTLLYLPRRG